MIFMTAAAAPGGASGGGRVWGGVGGKLPVYMRYNLICRVEGMCETTGFGIEWCEVGHF